MEVIRECGWYYVILYINLNYIIQVYYIIKELRASIEEERKLN